jgi:hypothetical protein
MASGSLEIWGGEWDSYAKGTHPFSFSKDTPPGSQTGPIKREILARYERGVMLLLFILAATMVALIIWLGAYLIGV